MSAWRREALERLPELRPRIAEAWSPMSLWIELYLDFETAVQSSNASLVQRLLQYAAWCYSQRSGPLPNDTSTAVACAFYEHLPTRKEFWPNFRAWFSPEEFVGLLPVFSYHLSPQELAELKVAYGQGLRPNNSFKPKPLRGSA